jgi:hypothetical protein
VLARRVAAQRFKTSRLVFDLVDSKEAFEGFGRDIRQLIMQRRCETLQANLRIESNPFSSGCGFPDAYLIRIEIIICVLQP